MFGKTTKVLAALLVFTVLFSCSGVPAFAFSLEENGPVQYPFGDMMSNAVYYANLSQFDQSSSQDQQMRPRGIKSYLVKEALKFISWLLKKGVTNDAVMSKVTEEFDRQAATALTRNARSIAAELEYLATIPDVTTQVVKEKLFYFMVNTLKMSGGSAEIIADGIANGINFLIF